MLSSIHPKSEYELTRHHKLVWHTIIAKQWRYLRNNHYEWLIGVNSYTLTPTPVPSIFTFTHSGLDNATNQWFSTHTINRINIKFCEVVLTYHEVLQPLCGRWRHQSTSPVRCRLLQCSGEERPLLVESWRTLLQIEPTVEPSQSFGWPHQTYPVRCAANQIESEVCLHEYAFNRAVHLTRFTKILWL